MARPNLYLVSVHETIIIAKYINIKYSSTKYNLSKVTEAMCEMAGHIHKHCGKLRATKQRRNVTGKDAEVFTVCVSHCRVGAYLSVCFHFPVNFTCTRIYIY
jgi:hypothetical protein